MTTNNRKPRAIRRVHRAQRADMPGLKTVRALPTRQLDQIDPFLFLNHHGPDRFEPNNDGLPFAPHPHRGMQTVTFIVEGDVLHRDNAGHDDSIIERGGVQWMVAGSGLLHLETSSPEFKEQGGDVEILQLWVNLPRDLKDVDPAYVGLQREDMPVVEVDDGKGQVRLIAGSFGDQSGAYEPLTDVEFYWVDLESGGIFETMVEPSRNIFCYIVQGSVRVNGEEAQAMDLIEFEDQGEAVRIQADEPSLVLFGHATPYEEPVAMGGPFVMNYEGEIRQAYEDLQQGRFGTWRAQPGE